MKMEAADSSKTLAPVYQTVWHHNTDSHNLKEEEVEGEEKKKRNNDDDNDLM